MERRRRQSEDERGGEGIAAAYLVHWLTASGAVLGFLALEAVIGGDLRAAFGWLAIALVVDAIDGPLARLIRITETAPRYDGRILDSVVDYLTYVLVPAAMLLQPEVMPHPHGLIAGVVIAGASALYFADTKMKSADGWFNGFPALWNIVLFHIVLFRPGEVVSLAAIAVLIVLMFAPVRFVHPLRVRALRLLSVSLAILWLMAAGWSVWQKFQPDVITRSVLIVVGVYFFLLGLLIRSKKQDE